MTIKHIVKSFVVAAIVAGTTLIAPRAANARVFVSVGIAPPVIPFYAQPLAPGYGYIWTPGYWAYGDDGYYWVDGAWVYPPYADALWTPGYWGWDDGNYLWNPGYWGLNIGYYGGINYGFGYFGTGFYGGYWNRGHFFYNGAYSHIGFHNGYVYNRRISGFDGRPGGAAFVRNSGGVTHAGQYHVGQNINRGAGINGHRFYGAGSQSFRGGKVSATNHGSNRGDRGINRSSESFGRGNVRGTAVRPAYNDAESRSNGGARTYTQHSSAPAPQARSYAGGGNVQAHENYSRGNMGGGGFHGGGGGGGSHGHSHR